MVSKIRGYKRLENNAVKAIRSFFCRFFSVIGRFFVSIFNGSRKKLTIMVVPHTQKRVFNFQTTIFSVILFVLIITGILGTFFWYSQSSVTAASSIASLKSEVQDTRASLDQMRDETANLIKAAQNFQTTFSTTLSVLGIKQVSEINSSNVNNGDLSAFFNVQETAQGTLRETAELQQLTSYLENSTSSIEEIGKLLHSQNTTFTETPNLWPLKNGIGHISMMFGRNKHPFTHVWYLHKGIDIANYRAGDPIVAVADGQVVSIEYDPSYGNTVIIKHKHGFYTRYAHMKSFKVGRGEYVQQGNIIGYVGNTGLSTGPHLHYEVHIGADVVDPISYLNIKKTKVAN